MLNPFPDLLNYSLLSPFILRLVVGLVFLDLGILIFKKEKDKWIQSFLLLQIPNPKEAVKIFGALHIIGGLSLILGFYTQIGSLILIIITLLESYVEYKEPVIIKRNFVFYIILLSVLVSLLLSGAGAFAIDLPL